MSTPIPPLPARDRIASLVESFRDEGSRRASKIESKYPADKEFLADLTGKKTREKMAEISEGYEASGSWGSAAYLKTYYLVESLSQQATLLKEGKLPSQDILEDVSGGLMIDTEATTPETLRRDQIFPTAEVRNEMNRSANVLISSLDRHISEKRRQVSDGFAREVTGSGNMFRDLKARISARGSDPMEKFGLKFDEVQMAELERITNLRYLDIEEARRAISSSVHTMIRSRPEVAGLQNPSYLLSEIRSFANSLAVEKADTRPLDLGDVNFIGQLMENAETMDGLDIYPGYAEAISTGIQEELPLPEPTSGHAINDLLELG